MGKLVYINIWKDERIYLVTGNPNLFCHIQQKIKIKNITVNEHKSVISKLMIFKKINNIKGICKKKYYWILTKLIRRKKYILENPIKLCE